MQIPTSGANKILDIKLVFFEVNVFNLSIKKEEVSEKGYFLFFFTGVKNTMFKYRIFIKLKTNR
jgi:hypothetical protein